MSRREDRVAAAAAAAAGAAQQVPQAYAQGQHVAQGPLQAATPGAAVPPGYMLVPQQPPRKRGLRPFSWVILVINAAFLVFSIVGAQTKAAATNCGSLDAATCTSAGQVGKGIGIVLIIVIWLVVDFLLLILWLITRPRQR